MLTTFRTDLASDPRHVLFHIRSLAQTPLCPQRARKPNSTLHRYWMPLAEFHHVVCQDLQAQRFSLSKSS